RCHSTDRPRGIPHPPPWWCVAHPKIGHNGRMSTPKKKQRAKTTQDNPGGGNAGTGNQNWTKRAPQSNAKTEHDQEGSAILTCLSALKYLTADQRGRVI